MENAQIDEIKYLREFSYENICFIDFLSKSIENFKNIKNLKNKDSLKFNFDNTNSENHKKYLTRFEVKYEEQDILILKWVKKNGYIIPQTFINNTDLHHFLLEKSIFPKYIQELNLLKKEDNNIIILLLKYLINNIIMSLKIFNNIRKELLSEKNIDKNKLMECQKLNEILENEKQDLEVAVKVYEDNPLMKFVDVQKSMEKLIALQNFSKDELIIMTGRLYDLEEINRKDINSLKEENKKFVDKLDSVQIDNINLKNKLDFFENEVLFLKNENTTVKKSFNDNLSKALDLNHAKLLEEFSQLLEKEKNNILSQIKPVQNNV